MKLLDRSGATMTVAPAGRAVVFSLAVALAGGLSACASGPSREAKGNLAAAMKQANIGPRVETPISMPEAGLRGFVAAKDMNGIRTAMAAMPTDTLLRMLNWGLAYHRLGMYNESNTSLQAAEREAEERYTKSITKAIGAALINDNVMDYNPNAMERAFIHYYGMLNYLALNNTEDALVEARKVDEYLARYARENGARSFTTDATVEYVSGLLHLSDGDQNDAMLAFRKAALGLDNYGNKYGVPAPQFVGADAGRLAAFMGIDDFKAQMLTRYQLQPDMLAKPANTGTLLVLIENGYVAYRAEQKLYFPVTANEANQLKTVAGAAILGPLVVKRAYDLFTEASKSGQYASDYNDGLMFGVMLTNAELVTMAWPKYVLNTSGVEEVNVTAGGLQMPANVMDDLSAIAVRQFEEDKPKIVERMILRGMTKYAMAKAAESEVKSRAGGSFSIKGQIAGFVAKQAAQKAAEASEKADIRSWSLLPGEIRVARFDLPAGTHDVTVNTIDSDGTPKTFNLGKVTIQPNKVVVKTQFVTGSYKGSTRRFANAQKGVDYKAATDTAAGRASTMLAFGAAAPIAAAPVVLSGAPVAAAPVGTSTTAAPPKPAAPTRAATTVTRVTPIVPEFKPLAGTAARFALTYKDVPAAGAPRATTSLLVVRPGSTDTLRVWSGAEGDTAFWNGMKDNAPVIAGAYNFIWRTQTPGTAAPTNLVLPGAIEVDAPKVQIIEKPTEPTMEPETREVLRPNYEMKSSKKKKGIILGILGAGMMVGGAKMIETAIETSPPGSPERMTGLGVWGGGLLFSTAGGFSFLNGSMKSYMHPVNEPDGGAIDRNKQAKDDYTTTLEQIRLQQEMLRDKTVIRIRIGGGR